MVQTIETFVEKLHSEGVQAGQEAAVKLRSEAQTQADSIIVEAQAEAESIIADAKAQAERTAEQQRCELDLAARDTVLRFRQAVTQAVTALLNHKVNETLTDADFLSQTIHDAVVNYAKEDAHGGEQIQINVHKDALDAVTNWALRYIGDGPKDESHAHVDLRSTLKSHGFEYRVAESTVEVTVESIVAVLKEQMSPRLGEMLDRALAGELS